MVTADLAALRDAGRMRVPVVDDRSTIVGRLLHPVHVPAVESLHDRDEVMAVAGVAPCRASAGRTLREGCDPGRISSMRCSCS